MLPVMRPPADRNGIDQSIVRATANALLAQMDRPYDPKYLIPEITVRKL
jgi:hypothetical protein